MISGCSDSQTSADAQFIDNSNNIINSGAMTFSFLQVLQNNKENNISYYNLIKNMRQILAENEFTQIPQLSSGNHMDINKEYFTL
jgi:hypothetical protein